VHARGTERSWSLKPILGHLALAPKPRYVLYTNVVCHAVMTRTQINLKAFLTIAIAGFFILDCAKAQSVKQPDNVTEEQITRMLKAFYPNYITELSKGTTNQDKVDSLLNRYCTLNLLNEIRFAWTYYPLLKVNTADVRMLENMTIKKDSKHNDLYYISYLYEGKKTVVKLIVVNQRGRYKIDYVWLDWSEDFSEEQIVKVLRTFYTNYIAEFEVDFTKVDVSKIAKRREERIDSVLNKYCTLDLLKEIQDAWDYDPFVKGQMIDVRMLDNLTIRKDSDHNDIYYVTYLYGSGKTTMKFVIINRRGTYKMDYLWLDII
jgi:hypothetical protein